MQGVVLFLHLYVGKFSDLFFNDKIFRAKIYIKFVGWAHNAGRSPSWGVVVLRWCDLTISTPHPYWAGAASSLGVGPWAGAGADIAGSGVFIPFIMA